ncbi:uncharacterized protein LY89DRAFT_30073 [Mollisia scopiformis]|uniref:Uncharacterized protein n=1 Tax=Mollisia scopiformis TaxID=149040 RepID=A0A194XCJ8_MOLSC|nr:uncharacterized protein LY89DRAFT_30073 [Mollisia scopiformis]KUJ17895.1 hypothetical protein LY89DRAFT_30073 [Mollisia scopiformis]
MMDGRLYRDQRSMVGILLKYLSRDMIYEYTYVIQVCVCTAVPTLTVLWLSFDSLVISAEQVLGFFRFIESAQSLFGFLLSFRHWILVNIHCHLTFCYQYIPCCQ